MPELKVNLSNKQLTELKEKGSVTITAPKEELNKEVPERAKMNKKYWYVDDEGDVVCREADTRHPIDDYRYYSGNYFLTREEAEQYAEYLKAIADIRKYVIENRYWFQPDWGDKNQEKIKLSFNTSGWEYWINTIEGNVMNLPYLPTVKAAETVIRDCAKELEIVKEWIVNNN